jgi:hypothetical protein
MQTASILDDGSNTVMNILLKPSNLFAEIFSLAFVILASYF